MDSNNDFWQIDSMKEDNPAGRKWLHPSNTDAEVTNNDKDMDILSNGFKGRQATGYHSDNNVNYFYMAFAESPFKTSNAR